MNDTPGLVDRGRFDGLILGSLYLIELCVVLIGLALYKKGDRPLAVFLRAPAGLALLVAGALLALTIVVLIFLVLTRRGTDSRRFYLLAARNAVSVSAAFLAAEIVIRVLAVPSPDGPVFAGTLLLPKSWQHVVEDSRPSLVAGSAGRSYLIFDNELGWTVGPSRRSQQSFRDRQAPDTGGPGPHAVPERPQGSDQAGDSSMYVSSTEGIRSPRAGMSFAAIPARHRIALVGDSFTFGLEVDYAHSWGHQLELALGPDVQVLNFGVDAYGVDQAYLRYQRDVLPWRPDAVILGVINDDFRRTLAVYGFVTFPGSGIPYPKPRFVMGPRGLEALNLPLPDPDSILGLSSIAAVPHIDMDAGYHAIEWDRKWYHHSYAIRYLLSEFPRWTVPGPAVNSDALRAVNGEFLQSFLRLAREQGSTPIVVYFPFKGVDLMPGRAGGEGIGRETMREYAIPYLDMTDCVKQVPPDQRFLALHYSPMTNAAVARCLATALGKDQ